MVVVADIKRFFDRKNFIKRLPHDFATFDLAAQIRARQSGKLIDALHLVTELRDGCSFFLSNDHGFKSTEHMEVVAIRDLVPAS